MKILDKKYEKVLFVHIPKTAGSSISKILWEKNLDNWHRSWPRHHDPYFFLKEHNQIDETVFSFSVVRNPYTRTYSCFKQFNKANKTNISFIQYLENISNNIVSPKSPLLHLPQFFYVVENNSVEVDKLYRFENLEQLELDFNWKLENYNVGNYTYSSYVEDYTQQAIDMVQKLYSTDFSLFEYDLDFKKVLEKK